MSDAVNSAFSSAASYAAFVYKPDGQPIAQSSSPEIIAAVLELLEVPLGARVLEVGTGSGYSTALLAQLTGSSGFVVSLDVDPELVKRAAQLLSQQDIDHVKVVSADGRAGYPFAAPFDRIVVWATGDVLTQAWVEQVRPGGLIVAPIRLLPLAATTAVVRVRVDLNGAIVGERIIKGAFVRLSSTPLYQWCGPVEEADIAVVIDNEPLVYASAEWLRSGANTEDRELAKHLLQTAVPQPSPLAPDEDAEALRAYLLATYPEGFTTGFTQALGHAIGCSCLGSLALLFQGGQSYVEAGEQIAAATFKSWIGNWRAVGRPGFEQLHPVVERESQGWRVSATL